MSAPVPRRPRLPARAEYGTHGREAAPEEALSWTTAEAWLAGARYYWLATTRPDGRPYSAPIWAVWSDAQLYFTTSPETATARNLAVRSDAVAHAESGSEVVILEGQAKRLPPDAVPADVVDAYEAKYGWRLDPSDAGMPYYALRPRVARTWLSSDIRATATRWEFGRPG
jgi:Pyridoxamine 5'-phosphate oxidase